MSIGGVAVRSLLLVSVRLSGGDGSGSSNLSHRASAHCRSGAESASLEIASETIHPQGCLGTRTGFALLQPQDRKKVTPSDTWMLNSSR